MSREKGRRLAHFVGALFTTPVVLFAVLAFIEGPSIDLLPPVLALGAVTYLSGWGLTRLWLWYKAAP